MRSTRITADDRSMSLSLRNPVRMRRMLCWFAAPLLLATLLSVVVASPAAAADPVLPYTWNCGGELEAACTVDTAFWLSNGNFGCDRGLIESGGQCYNGDKFGDRARYTATMDDYQSSWAKWAEDNQRSQLAADQPINQVMTISAHNGYNNTADGYLDVNQRYSLTDQLRGGARSLDLDLVWQNNEVRLCHGGPSGSGDPGICSNFDRFYANAVKEIGSWLDANPDQVIYLEYEDRFPIANDDGTQDDRVNNPIELYLDRRKQQADDTGRVFRPAEFHAAAWPSERQLLAQGKQVILFDGANTHGGKFLFGNYTESGLDAKDVNYSACTEATPDQTCYIEGSRPAGTLLYPSCLTNAGASLWQDDAYWTAVGEDRTYFGGVYAGRGLLDSRRVNDLARCNVSQISIDMLNAGEQTNGDVCREGVLREPAINPCADPDDRVKATIWSWAEDDKGQFGTSALFDGGTGRWHSRDPGEEHHFACLGAETDAPDGDWRVTKEVGPWSDGTAFCRSEYGAYFYTAPVNGPQNDALHHALAAAERDTAFDGTSHDVWLAYSRQDAGTVWTVGAPQGRVLSTTQVSVPANAVYNGQPIPATATTTGTDLQVATPVVYAGQNGTTYGPSTAAPSAAGDYLASARFPGDSAHIPSSGSASYTIGRAALAVRADDASKLVGQPNPSLTGTLTGVVAGDAITATYTTSAGDSSPSGTYPIVPVLSDPNHRLANYTITSTNGTLTVLRLVQPLKVTISSPVDGAVVELGSAVLAQYSCSSGVTVLFCIGSAPVGTPIDTASVGPKSFTVTAQDTITSVTNTVTYTVRDTTAPTVSIATPADGAVYSAGQVVAAGYACADLALVSCTGTVATGSAVDTATLGPKSFVVTGTDTSGNHTSATVHYSVVAGAPALVTATSGSTQSAATRAGFTSPLVATVTDALGNAVPGVPVVFQVTSGSASFPGGATSVSVNTTAAGVATSPTLSAGATAGPVVVTATSGAASGVNAATFLETVTAPGTAKADLSVTLAAPATTPLGTSATVTVTVRNNGPSASGNYAAALLLPRSLAVTALGGGTRYGGAVVFRGTTLTTGQAVAYTVTVRAASPKGATILGALVLAATADPKLSNNVAAKLVRIT